jgi:four helix bundle protein
MKLKILDVALESLEVLRPVLLRIRREDPGLHRQLRDALNSMVLNLSEGEYSDPGTRKARFHTACGSTNEARGAVLAAQAWGYVSAAMCEPGLARLDRVVATLWKLTH